MSSNAKKRDQKILIKIAVALCYGVLSAMAINMFLSHANSYSAGLLGVSQLLQALDHHSSRSISPCLRSRSQQHPRPRYCCASGNKR